MDEIAKMQKLKELEGNFDTDKLLLSMQLSNYNGGNDELMKSSGFNERKRRCYGTGNDMIAVEQTFNV